MTSGIPTIAAVRVTAHRASLPRPWGPDVPHNTVVAVTVEADDGSVGVGFGWTPTIGGTALAALVRDDVVPAVLGLPADAAIVSRTLFSRLHEGGSGLVQNAAAAIDLALWDRDARSVGLPLADRIGRERDTVAAYGSGVNLHYPIDELVAQVRRFVDRGFRAVKVKVGKPDLGEDLDRLDAVRDVLGPDRELMVDANQRWDLAHAVRAARAFSRIGVHWLEEPLRADDTAGYARLRSRIDLPIAMGENAHTVYRFRDLIEAGACDILQPNVSRVGGITPFLRIAELADAHSMPIAPHLLPDVSAQLALTLVRDTPVEDVEDAGLESLGLLVGGSPVAIADGIATVERRPGLGLSFVD